MISLPLELPMMTFNPLQSHRFRFLLPLAVLVLTSSASLADEPEVKIGMIGLDTSHAPAFTKLINNAQAGELSRMRVVAAYPGGSPDIASSRDRVEGFTEQLREMGVQIVPSIEELLTQVDAVLLESVDGRTHLQQVLPVFQAQKPVFIDKPLAGNLVDAICIDLLAKEYQARWFTSSSLRFSPSIAKYRNDEDELPLGAAAWSPCSIEPSHSDLFWYGIHGVETLYTAMGTGCEKVTRIHSSDVDLVVGQWPNSRIGTFRGIRNGKSGYGLTVFGQKQIETRGKYEGYAPLVDEIAKFFLGGEAPVKAKESLELLTFMAAADESKHQGGSPVELKQVWAAAMKKAEAKIVALVP